MFLKFLILKYWCPVKIEHILKCGCCIKREDFLYVLSLLSQRLYTANECRSKRSLVMLSYFKSCFRLEGDTTVTGDVVSGEGRPILLLPGRQYRKTDLVLSSRQCYLVTPHYRRLRPRLPKYCLPGNESLQRVVE